jgi:beta-aspartyl-peptidase (threonine type)
MKSFIISQFQFVLFLLLGLFLFSCQPAENDAEAPKAEPETMDWSIVIHGGAGHFDSESYSVEQEAEYEQNLQAALEAGQAILSSGGASADAVQAAIVVLEDCPLFNAGKGAVFTAEGINEMDASFMDGTSLNCGAVTGIQRVKNPIKAARGVMDESEHVFFSGKGATSFAENLGLELVDSSYFKTEKSWNRYLQVKAKEEASALVLEKPDKFGTVGCVALDQNGNICAGTSTGGMTWKRNGRIGDSPVISAGTYADSKVGGISCTGHGEYFIRAAVAHDIIARSDYKDISLEVAAEEVIMEKLVDMGGEGGVVGLDNYGRAVMVFNSAGMFRGYANSTGELEVLMYGPYESK